MTGSAMPTTAAAQPALDAMFGAVWPETRSGGRPRLVGAAVAVGLLAAVLVPFRTPGLALFLALLASCSVVALADPKVRSVQHAVPGLLCVLLISTLAIRDAQWVVAVCLTAAFTVGSVTLVGARSVGGQLAAGAAIPLAALRGVPWLGRSLTMSGRRSRWWSAVRALGWSVLLVLVFGSLFASADALFASWVGALVPDLSVDTFVARGLVFAVFAALTLAGVYVALNPAQVERLALPAGKPVARRFEWLVPLGLVVTVFAVFVVAQLTVMFGGHDYLQRTTGVTYADYVHQGFGQLTATTFLTLAVVAGAVRKAPRHTSTDRLLLRLTLGSLCALTLVVVASALFRIHVYEQAYGFTRLRLLVSVFEGWLGLVVVLVIGAGVALRGRWVPLTALVIGSVLVLGLAAVNPDAYIARANVERFEQTGLIDWSYLAGLSADAEPALAALPAKYQHCVAGGSSTGQDDWLEWNFGRARARGYRLGLDLGGTGDCTSTTGGSR